MRTDSDGGNQLLDDIRGAQEYFQALQRDNEPYDLRRKSLQRFAHVAECARRRIGTDQLFREASSTTRGRFLEMVSAFASVANGAQFTGLPDDTCWTRDALEDALGDHVDLLMSHRAEFKRTIESESAQMSPSDSNRLLRVIREIVNGLSMSGIEQGECIRSARNEAQDLISDATGDKNPIGWLFMGWLCLWNSSSSNDASGYFDRGISLATDKTGFLAHLLYRYRAVGHDIAGRPMEALTDAKAALALYSSPELLFEAARYSVQLHNMIEARKFLEAAIKKEPLTIFVAMADTELGPAEKLIYSGYASAEAVARTSALKAVEEWHLVVNTAHECESKLGAPLELPAEICSGFGELRLHAANRGFLESLGVRSEAMRNGSELYQIAVRRVNTIVEKRLADTGYAKASLDSANKKKDTVGDKTRRQAEQLITQMESELERSMGVEDKGAQGCAMGLGGSFAMFMAFVVAAGFLKQHGIDTSLDSPIGMLGVCLIFAPIAIGLGANMASGIKRSAVGSEAQRRAAHAREMAKLTLVEVEKNCARQAESLQKATAKVEIESQRAVEAQRILRESPQLAGTTIIRLAASELAA